MKIVSQATKDKISASLKAHHAARKEPSPLEQQVSTIQKSFSIGCLGLSAVRNYKDVAVEGIEAQTRIETQNNAPTGE